MHHCRRPETPRYSRDTPCPCAVAPGNRQSRIHRTQFLAAYVRQPGYGSYFRVCRTLSPLFVACDVARHRDALVAGFQELIEHLVMPRDDIATAQDAPVTGRDAFDVEFLKHSVDAAADRVGGRAFEPPVTGVEHK